MLFQGLFEVMQVRFKYKKSLRLRRLNNLVMAECTKLELATAEGRRRYNESIRRGRLGRKPKGAP